MTSTIAAADVVAAPPASASELTAQRRMWLGFSAVICASILNIVDSTLVNVAGPSIRASFEMSTASLEWISAAYTLALAIGLMTGARLGDMFGRRRLFIIGLVGFIATSVLCSAAWSDSVLVAGRALQGVAAALMLPQNFGLMRDLFGPQRVGKAFGVMGPVIGISTVLGPVIAGLLIRADVLGSGWRSLFWLNVPLGAYALIMGVRHLPAGHGAGRTVRLDLGGVMLLAVASFLLIFPLVEGRVLDWPTWVFAGLIASIPAFGIFVAHQRRRLNQGVDALLEFSVLRKRSYVCGVGFLMFFFGALVGFNLTIGLFLQIGLGYTPMRASLYLAALAVGSFVGAGIGSWAVNAVGRPILHIGLAIMAVAVGMIYLSLDRSATVGAGQLLPGLGVFGLGMGMIFVPLFSIVMGDIEDREVGSASGLLTSVEQLGASLGVAILGTVFFSVLQIEKGGPVVAHLAGRDVAAVQHTLIWTVGMIAVAFVLGWFLPRRARVGAAH